MTALKMAARAKAVFRRVLADPTSSEETRQHCRAWIEQIDRDPESYGLRVLGRYHAQPHHPSMWADR